MKPTRSHSLLHATATVLLLGAAAFASAQTTPAAKTDEVITLPTFTITETPVNPYVSKQALSGTRVAMNIQDIPQTVSIVTSDFIQDSMSARMLDAAKYVTPVVESTLPFGGDRYTIRGFQVSHEFIDGMVISGEDGYSMSIAPYNIDRVEIIKGPNAILVPGGAPGGQFNPITKSPIMKDQQSLTLELSQYIGNAISTDINRVLSQDKGIAARLVAAYWNSNGYQKNHFRQGWLVAPSISWQLSTDHKLTVKAELVDNLETNGTALPIDPSIGSDGYAIIAKGLPRNFSFGNDDDHRQRNTERITLELLSTLSDHITSRLMLSGDHILREDQGGTSAAIGTLNSAGTWVAFNPTRNPYTGKYEPGVVWTVDNSGPVAIATSTVTPLPDPSAYVYRRNNGSDHLYYNEAHFRNDYAAKFDGQGWKSTTIAGLAANFEKVHWKSFPAQPRGDVANNNLGAIGYLPYIFPEPSAPNNGQNKKAKHQEMQLYAYENASFFGDRLQLSGGVSRYFGTLTRTDNSGVQPIGDRTLEISTTAKSYGVVVKPIKEVAFFYSKNDSGSTMPGSLQAGNPGLLPPFKPSAGTQNEYGVKGSFLKDTLTFSFAKFDISQTNYPVPNSEYYTLVAQGNQAAANLLSTSVFLDVNSKGWEFEGSYALSKNLTVIGNLSKFQYRQPNGVRIRAVPDNIAGLYADYRFSEGPLSGFGINIGMDHKSDMVGESVTALTTTKPLTGVGSFPNTPAGFVPSVATYKYNGRTLINLGFSYRAKDWTARVQIENVADKDYIKAGGSRTAIVVGDPRYVKGSITYRF